MSKLTAAARAVANIFTRGPRTASPIDGRQSFAYGFTGYTPHEPFTQAWQKGVANANPRDTNLMAFSAVYACVTIIAQDLAKMPMRVMETGDDGITEKIALNSPYHRLLRRPNWYQTPVDFVLQWSAGKLMRGNSYAFKELDSRGVPSALHIMHPDRTVVLIEPQSKEVFYQYTPHHSDMFQFGESFFNSQGTVIIPSRFVLHDRVNAMWHPLVGVSPLFAAAVTAATGARILLNSERFFSNMSRPSGMLTAPGEIGEVTAERLKREFEANYKEGNFGRTAVLGDGLEWKPMVMTSTDAQLIEQLKFTVEDVARAFRVPMYLLADVTRMTYKNSEQAAQSYFSGCLQYHVESTESAFGYDFGLQANQHVAFDVRGLFRMDTTERFAAYREGVNGSILSPNEARALEGLGPVKGGEEPRIQMQYVPLSKSNQPVEPAPAPIPVVEITDGEEDNEEDDRAFMADILRMTSSISAARAKVEAITGEH